jgi:hypothetical protein
VARAAASVILAAVAAGSLPAAIPTPASHFGHPIGADKTVLDWQQVVDYFRLLEKSSDRVKVDELGKSTMGRPFIAVTIAAPDTRSVISIATSKFNAAWPIPGSPLPPKPKD